VVVFYTPTSLPQYLKSLHQFPLKIFGNKSFSHDRPEFLPGINRILHIPPPAGRQLIPPRYSIILKLGNSQFHLFLFTKLVTIKCQINPLLPLQIGLRIRLTLKNRNFQLDTPQIPIYIIIIPSIPSNGIILLHSSSSYSSSAST